MSTSAAKWAGRTIFEKHLKQYEPADPVYETYTDDNGRQKRRKVRPSYRRTRWFHAPIIKLSAKFILSPARNPSWLIEAGRAYSQVGTKARPPPRHWPQSLRLQDRMDLSFRYVGARFPPGIILFSLAYNLVSRGGPRCRRRTQCRPGLLLGRAKGQTSRVEQLSIASVLVPELIIINHGQHPALALQ